MKKVSCASPSCGKRWENYRIEPTDSPVVSTIIEEPRTFWVVDEHVGPSFCSIECELYYRIESQPKQLGEGDPDIGKGGE